MRYVLESVVGGLSVRACIRGWSRRLLGAKVAA
jgi:hypothetical protein